MSNGVSRHAGPTLRHEAEPPSPSSAPSSSSHPLDWLTKPEGLRRVDDDSLEVDEELQGVPLLFILDQIRFLGQRLIHTSRNTTLAPPSPGTALPPFLLCRYRSIIDDEDASDHPLPTHVLPITFSSQPNGTLVLLHGLCWALLSARLSSAARSGPVPPPPPPSGSTSSIPPSAFSDSNSAPDAQVPPTLSQFYALVLPPIRLPSVAAFEALQTWIYTGNTSSLLNALVDFSPTNFLRTPAHFQGTQLAQLPSPGPTVHDRRENLKLVPLEALVNRLGLLRDLRETVVYFEVADDDLWEALETAWNWLATAIRFVEDEAAAPEVA